MLLLRRLRDLFSATRERPAQAFVGLLAVLALVVVAAVLFAWSGVYNVAASRGHFYVVDRFLRFGMVSSVRARAPNFYPPDLDDPERIKLGAAHYYGGCTFCHGAPGSKANPVVQQMLPQPPDLQSFVPLWNDQELFWIIKNGLKYAGMPAWPAQDRDDEVWSVVAFVRTLPRVTPAEFQRLALGGVSVGHKLATSKADPDAVGACARCHGAEGQAPHSALVPVLHGQPVDWLTGSLKDYAEGKRHSGIMQPLATPLSPGAIAEVTHYYAGLDPPAILQGTSEPTVLESGRRLAMLGAPHAEVPPCLGCHDAGRSTVYPRLAGQSGRYITAQLLAWRNGKSGTSATNAIMEPIARRLSDKEIAEVAAYFSSLTPREARAP